VDESPGPCAFARCFRSAEFTVELLVEGEESILAACDLHADWLRGYVREDDAVQVIDELPLLAGERFAEDDLADPA
jgi:hypothetical protein